MTSKKVAIFTAAGGLSDIQNLFGSNTYLAQAPLSDDCFTRGGVPIHPLFCKQNCALIFTINS